MELSTMSRPLPDFTFPPKSRYANIPSPQRSRQQRPETETSKVHRTLPNFGFKFHPTPAPSSPPMAEIKAQILQPKSSSSTSTAVSPSLFLSIPVEIRFQIYGYLLDTSRIHHAHLAPLACEQPISSSGLNTEEFHTIMLRPAYISTPKSLSQNLRFRKEERRCIVDRSEKGEVRECGVDGNGYRNQERKVRGKMPTGLLASCKQVYRETHRLPFENNTFTFINWFWSGIYAAKQFTGNLASWQQESLRWVGIEVLGGDLWVDRAVGGNFSRGKGLGEWIELCGLWSGSVRGVRVCIKGGLEVAKKRGAEKTVTDDEESKESLPKPAPDTILDVTADWVTRGLCALTQLRRLELEIEDEDVSRTDKVAFCADLSVLLNTKFERPRTDGKSAAREGEVEVIFRDEVEVPKEVVLNKDFTWYGGEPGDDMIWGDGA